MFTAPVSPPARRTGPVPGDRAANEAPAPGAAGRDQAVRAFLDTKARSLKARARRLGQLSPARVGLRAADRPYSPANSYFHAANKRLGKIDRSIRRRLAELERMQGAPVPRQLLQMALVEREVDRSRRAFGMFFEVFAQRGTGFSASLAAHDAIARDCYRAALAGQAEVLKKPLLMPITYLEHGYSPATMRRGVTLKRLLGEPNPFPLIRIPWDRDVPWQATFLHEVAHNLQADLGIWDETREAVARRLAESGTSSRIAAIWSNWPKEIFADLAALLLGGPAAAFGLAEFLAHPGSKVANFRSGGVHPTGYIRVLILAEMVRRMGFAHEAEQLGRIWTKLYRAEAERRLPQDLMTSAPRILRLMVDEIAFQPRRMLAERSLADILPFRKADQARIVRGARQFRKGRVPDLPPRWLVSAARLAISSGADAGRVGRALTRRLAADSAAARRQPQTIAPAPADRDLAGLFPGLMTEPKLTWAA
ncbi:hypothetical protein [Poseidonocella sp. HB161398]|uniref:hypothetical protein n=1 Tax=Poseidonocella sp. HB161398 TaxID=2320855 RepID=UPI0019823015|nr:hypothetical protein [Poseidonocella sp. HB161398]